MGDTKHSSHVTDHAFVPKKEWWTRCAKCGLSEAAHAQTTLTEEQRR